MTGLTSNIDSVIEHFKKMADQTADIDVSQALLAGVNAAKARMQNRIFNEGKDASGESLGGYTGQKQTFSLKRDLSKSFLEKLDNSRLLGGQHRSGKNFQFSEYELVRLTDGRQIAYKDLELTGSLRRGIVPVNAQDRTSIVSKVRVVCAIPNGFLYDISIYQEKQIAWIRAGKPSGGPGSSGRVPIFTLSEDEKAEMKLVVNEIIKQLYVRVLNP